MKIEVAWLDFCNQYVVCVEFSDGTRAEVIRAFTPRIIMKKDLEINKKIMENKNEK